MKSHAKTNTHETPPFICFIATNVASVFFGYIEYELKEKKGEHISNSIFACVKVNLYLSKLTLLLTQWR